ncbi:MAG: hypothetical protein AB7O73_09515 [Bacteroidia bacterium]
MTRIVKIIVVLITMLSITSCKKKYQCACTTQLTIKYNNGVFDTFYYPGERKEYSEKMTQKQAQAACDHNKEAVERTFTSAYTNNGSYVFAQGEKINTECVLTN